MKKMPAKLFAVVCNKIITAISQRQQQKKRKNKKTMRKRQRNFQLADVATDTL